MAVSAPPWLFQQLLDNDGLLLAGGSIGSYVAGSTTPQATYTDATATTPNENPIPLDSSGRCEIWLTEGLSYKFILYDADGVTLDDVDGVTIAAAAEAAEDRYSQTFQATGTPADNALIGIAPFPVNVTFGEDFDGFASLVMTNATAPYTITVRKYPGATTVATFSIAIDGTVTAETSGLEVSFAAGESMVMVGQASADATLANFAITVLGEVS